MLKAGLKLKIYEDDKKDWKKYTIEKKLEKTKWISQMYCKRYRRKQNNQTSWRCKGL